MRNAIAVQSEGRDKLPNELRLVAYSSLCFWPALMSWLAPGKGYFCCFHTSFAMDN